MQADNSEWQLDVAASAARDISRLPEKAAAAVLETLAAIVVNPFRIGKPLRFELEGLWVTRRGPYRVIYEINQGKSTVTVVAVGHRADIYRKR